MINTVVFLHYPPVGVLRDLCRLLHITAEAGGGRHSQVSTRLYITEKVLTLTLNILL